VQAAPLPSTSAVVTVSADLRGVNNLARPPVKFAYKSGLLSQFRVLTSCWNLWAERHAQVLMRMAGHVPCHAAPVSWWVCGFHWPYPIHLVAKPVFITFIDVTSGIVARCCNFRVGLLAVAHAEAGCITDVPEPLRFQFLTALEPSWCCTMVTNLTILYKVEWCEFCRRIVVSYFHINI
jgi:hypothetical protein